MEAKEWDKMVDHPMQGWAWGEFRARMGNRVSRVGGDNQYQIIWTRIKTTSLWFGYCPMAKMPTENDLKLLRDGGIGIRFEPNEVMGAKIPEGLVEGRHLFKPKTYWIDLTKSEDGLQAAMHPKARYNIRLAQKHGVIISEGASIDDYLRLIFDKTTQRQKIYAHTDKYHQELPRQDFVHMFKAEYKGKGIAAWMLFVWKENVYYAYGAFDDEFRDKMAPVLGLWEIIRWAKKQGYKALDLWGAEEGRGFSRFKDQFGPKLVEMVGTYDLPINKPVYYLFRIAEEIRWKILRMWK